MSNRTRLFFDRSGVAFERLLGEPRPALWLRGAERLPTLNEAKLLSEVTGRGPNILLWAVAKASDDPDRAFRYFRELSAKRVGTGELMALTGLGSINRPSHIDIADGTDCAPETFRQFVADSTFSRLSGVIFGPVAQASNCIRILSKSIESWASNTGSAGERELLATVDELDALSCTSVVCIADSDTRNYWAIVLDTGTVISTGVNASLMATSEEFAAWERIGWDVRSLNRSAP